LTFKVEDYKAKLSDYNDFKVVIFSYDSDLLGSISESLKALKTVVPPAKGYILFDNAIRKNETPSELNKSYPSFKETKSFIADANLQIFGYIYWDMPTLKRQNDFNNTCIAGRARELKEKYPDKSEILQQFVANQLHESNLLATDLICVTWLLKNG
jgi:hypothetical protein